MDWGQRVVFTSFAEGTCKRKEEAPERDQEPKKREVPTHLGLVGEKEV